jgi:hypothetical protein
MTYPTWHHRLVTLLVTSVALGGCSDVVPARSVAPVAATSSAKPATSGPKAQT